MNKVEVELTEALIKIEQDAARLSSNYGNSLTQSLAKNPADFKVVLFKMLASNSEENE